MQEHQVKNKVFIALVLLAVLFASPKIDDHLQAITLMLRVMDPHTESGFTRYRSLSFREQAQVLPSGMKTRWYVPAELRADDAMLVVHGVHRLGIDEPRLVAFSRALASQGIEVMTPQLPGIADFRITPESITTIGDAAKELRARTGKKVGLFGLSFSGGLALMAAADARFKNDVAFVVAVGAHHDLSRVASFFATNETFKPDGTKFHIQAHEYGALVLAYAHPEDFFPHDEAEVARACLRAVLYETTCQESSLPAATRVEMKYVFAHDAAHFADRILATANKHQAEYAAVSPRGKLAGLQAKVLLLHGLGDDVIPASETEWLAKEVPGQSLEAALISPAVSHVEMGDKPNVIDQVRVVHFIAQMFEEAEQ